MSHDCEDVQASGHPHSGGRDLTTGSIPRHLIAFSIPLLSASILQTLYSVINAFWVGNALGSNALSAVGISMSMFFVLMAAAVGLTMGANIVCSQAYGAKDLPHVRRVVQSSVVLTAIVSAVCAAVGSHYIGVLMQMIHPDAAVVPLAMSYMGVFIWTMPLTFEMFLMISLLRGIGDSKTPLSFQAVSLVVNAILDPLLIYGWAGFPKMGLMGTAVATIVSQGLALSSLLIYLHRKRHLVSPDWRHLRADAGTSWLMLKIGGPAAFQQSIIALGMFTIMTLVNKYGAIGMAAYTLATRIDQFALLPSMMVGTAVATLAGQNIGAKQFHRVKEVLKWGLVLGCGMTLIVTTVALTLPGPLMRLFIKDQSVINIGVAYLHIIAMGYLFFAIFFVGNGVINGSGHTLIATAFSAISLWIVRVPLAVYISGRIHRIEGIWYAMLISYFISSCMSMGYYASGRWRRPVIKR